MQSVMITGGRSRWRFLFRWVRWGEGGGGGMARMYVYTLFNAFITVGVKPDTEFVSSRLVSSRPVSSVREVKEKKK